MRAPIVTACAALALSACNGTPDEPRVTVKDAVVTLPAVPGRPGAAYFELRANRTPTNLVSLTSPLVRKIELHQSRTRNGKSHMQPLDNTAFPGNGIMEFRPGGKHAMLTGIDKSVKEGSKIPITFTFDPAPAVTVEAEVRGAGEAHEGSQAEAVTVRPLTKAERTLAASVFGSAIDYDAVTVKRRKWFPFQPRDVLMAPTGHVHIHPQSDHWSDDFGQEHPERQGWFLHELTHVWQSQRRGKYYLPLMRHPFCRYSYVLKPGWPLHRYGLEQQAEIVRHAFLLREGAQVPGAPPLVQYETVLPFAR